MGMYGDGVQPVYDLNASRNYDGAWGDGGFMWVFFLFFLLAWGGGGFGGGFGNNASTDLINGISNDLIYSNLNSTLGQGFTQLTNQNFGISKDLSNGFNQLGNGLCTTTYELSNKISDVGSKIQSCCCETNRNIDAVRYENAKNTCDIITNANMNTRDLLESNNAQTQRILDYLTNQEIQNLRSDLQSAQLQLSNLSQTASIIDQLRPFPIPAYITCSPYANALGTNGCNSGLV